LTLNRRKAPSILRSWSGALALAWQQWCGATTAPGLRVTVALRLRSSVWPGHCCLQRQHDLGTTTIVQRASLRAALLIFCGIVRPDTDNLLLQSRFESLDAYILSLTRRTAPPIPRSRHGASAHGAIVLCDATTAPACSCSLEIELHCVAGALLSSAPA
jgi:hypothetical protein